jgi:hypothetical protein
VPRLILITSLLALTTGCVGAISVDGEPDGPRRDAPTSPGAAGDAPASPEGPAADLSPAFEVSPERVKLLPFRARRARLVHLTGLPADDAAFETLDFYRFELGDHDYANGLRPDQNWTAQRISTWVRAVLPICAHPALAARYPDFPDQPDAFILAAYGRRATADDRATLTESLAGLDLDRDAAARSACVALLSTTEFVAR